RSLRIAPQPSVEQRINPPTVERVQPGRISEPRSAVILRPPTLAQSGTRTDGTVAPNRKQRQTHERQHLDHWIDELRSGIRGRLRTTYVEAEPIERHPWGAPIEAAPDPVGRGRLFRVAGKKSIVKGQPLRRRRVEPCMGEFSIIRLEVGDGRAE